MEVSTKEMQAALAVASPGLGKAGFVQNAEYIVFRDGRMWTFNSDIGAACASPEPLADLLGAVDGQKLCDFAAKAPGETMRFKHTDKGLQVRSKRATITLTWIDGADIGDAPYEYPKKWTTVPAELAEAIALCSVCCSTNLVQPLYTCVRIGKEHVVSTDTTRAIQYTLDEPLKKDFGVLVPRLAALVAAKLPPVKMTVVDGNVAWFKSKVGHAIFVPLMDGEYPDINEHIEANADDAVDFPLPLHDLAPVIDRAKIFSGEDIAMGDDFVTVSVEGKKLYVEASDDRSQYREWIPLKEEAPELSVLLNTQHLLDLVQQEQETDCSLSEKLGRLWLRSKKWQYVSMVRAAAK